MDDKDNPHVSIETFNQFKTDNASLCLAYRKTMEQKFLTVDEKINGLRNQIIGAISLSTAILGLLSWYLTVIR